MIVGLGFIFNQTFINLSGFVPNCDTNLQRLDFCQLVFLQLFEK